MPRNSRWMMVALALSLALNLVLLGFGAARVLDPRMPPPRMDPALAFFPVLRELPDERQALLRPLMREQFRNARPAMRAMRHAQRAIETALVADPYDHRALGDALAEFRGALFASQEASHGALAQLANAMTPVERRALATAMRERGRRDHSRRDGERRAREDGAERPARAPLP